MFIFSPKDCGTPVKEGYLFSTPNPKTLYGSTVNVSCADCYGEGPDKSQLTCEADGNWTDISGCNKKGTCLLLIAAVT